MSEARPSPLRDVRRYLEGLLPYLDALRPGPQLHYDVPGLGRLTTLRQVGHRLFETGPDPSAGFGFAFERVGDTCLVAHPSGALLRAHQARLRSLRLKHQLAPDGHGGNLLVVPSRVPVELRFVLDADTVTVWSMNFQALGPRSDGFPRQEIDGGWLQALVRSLLHRPDTLHAPGRGARPGRFGSAPAPTERTASSPAYA